MKSTAEKQEQLEAKRARFEGILAGIAEEISALNEVIRSGRAVRFPKRASSMASEARVIRAYYAHDGITVITDAGHFNLDNGERWAEVLAAAGVARDARAKG